MNRKSIAVTAFSIAAIAAGSALSVAVAKSAANPIADSPAGAFVNAPVTVQFPTFASGATTATLSFQPNRIRVAGLSASAATRLINLDSAGRITSTVVVKLGTTSTFTLLDVIVTSATSSTGGAAPGAGAVLDYASIRSA
jgi:hypothetical protein